MAGAVQKHPDLEGFICPQCMVKFPSDVRVRAHWVEFHAGVKKPEKAKTERKKDEASNATARAPEPKTPKGIVSHLRHKIAKGRGRYIDSTFDLDLTYITERIIAMSFPASGLESTYRNNLEDVARMLQLKHQDKFMVFNLSDRSYDVTKLNFQVLDFGWPDHLAPPLERLCCICKSIDSWLASDPLHVVVVHCKGGKGRTGTVISAYMHYSNMCQSAEAALDQFAMKRFYDDKLGGVTQPSQRRYVHYFEDVLKRTITLIDTPVFLTTTILHGIPNFDGRGGCRLFLKIYQNLELIHTTDVHVGYFGQEWIKITFTEGLELSGDILVKGFHKTLSGRDIVFRCQFHTCAVTDYVLLLQKSDLDDACRDKRFPEASSVEFVFTPPLIDIKKGETIRRALERNSGETMEDVGMKSGSFVTEVGQERTQPDGENRQSSPSSVEHYKGPVDESLYTRPGMRIKVEKEDGVEDPRNKTRRLSDYEKNWYRRVQEAGVALQVKSVHYPSDSTKLSCHSDWHIEELDSPPADIRMTSNIDRLCLSDSTAPMLALTHGTGLTTEQPVFGTVLWSNDSKQTEDDLLNGSQTQPCGPYTQVPGVKHLPKAKSFDDPREQENAGITNSRKNSYSAWVQSKHNGVARGLISHLRGGSESGLMAGDQDWLIQLSPPPGKPKKLTKSNSDEEKRKSFNPFEDLDAAVLEELRAEVGQRKDNPFADALESSGSAVSKASDSKGKKAEKETSASSSKQPSQLKHAHSHPDHLELKKSFSIPDSDSKGKKAEKETSASSSKQPSQLKHAHSHPDHLELKKSFSIPDSPFSIPFESEHPQLKHTFSSPDTLSGLTLADSLPSLEQKRALFFTNRWGVSQSQGSKDGDSERLRQTTDAPPLSTSSAVVEGRQEPVGQSSGFAASYASEGPQLPPRKASSKKERPVLPPRRPEGLNLGKQFWYKPRLGKVEAEVSLMHTKPGTFLVRESQSLKGSFSLVMKTTQYYFDSSMKRTGGVKHFLILKTEEGLQLKGSSEPTFSSLTQFVLQHSISALQLPCKLVIPMKDIVPPSPRTKSPELIFNQESDEAIPPPKPPLPSTRTKPHMPPNPQPSNVRYGADGPAVKLSDPVIESLTRGASTELTYLLSVDVPLPAGPDVVRSAVSHFIARGPLQRPTPVHFEVNISGVLLVDKKQTVFFRRHYPIRSVTYCVVDPDDTKWKPPPQMSGSCEEKSMFGIVARKPGTTENYVCHLFAEKDDTQPAKSIVRFINSVMELSAM